MAGVSGSDPQVVNAFGGLPYYNANLLQRQQISPLVKQLGYQHGRGPLAGLINDIRGFAPGVTDQAQQLGSQIAGLSQDAYGQYSGQLQSFLGALPGYQKFANQSLNDAYSPVQSRALYQQTFNNAVDPLRAGSAARGLLDSGAAQSSENDLGRQLALQFAGQDQQNQSSALQNALSTSQAGLGPTLGNLTQAIPGLQQGGSQGFQLPIQAAGSLLQLLTSGAAPSLQQLGAVAPTSGSSSKGFNIL